MKSPHWTEADAAELDVLVHELARGHGDHRERCAACQRGGCPALGAWREHLDDCRACRGDAPLTPGQPCHRHREFVDRGDGCVRCNRCPHLAEAIGVVVGWREARILRSRAEALRIEQTIAAATRRVA